MGGLIGNSFGPQGLPRPASAPAGAPTAPPAASGAPASEALGRDSTQLPASGIPTEQLMSELSSMAGGFSLDDLGADLMPSERTPADMRRDADAIWFGLPEDKPSSYLRLERDATDVNEPGVDALGTKVPQDVQGAEMAREQLAANAELEQAALKGFSGTERAQYDRISQELGADPQARLALQLLLVEGKLTKGPKAHDGDTLLRSLDEMATAPLAKGIARDKLLGDTVQEIAVPSAIAQHHRGTCSATTLQIKMAMERAAEYARLLTGLASPSGKVKLPNGESLQREAGTGTDQKILTTYQGKPKEINDLRSVSSQLWQPALMQYGYGPKYDYDNKTDTVTGGAAPSAAMVTRMAGGLTSKGVETVRSWREEDGVKRDNRDALIERLTREASPERPVPTGLVWGEVSDRGGHEVLVTKVADERVYFNNPHGREESMGLEEFRTRMAGGFIHLTDFSGT